MNRDGRIASTFWGKFWGCFEELSLADTDSVLGCVYVKRPSKLAGKSSPGLHVRETHNQNSVLWGWVGLSNREGATFGSDVRKASPII